jgi:hypothetical protein
MNACGDSSRLVIPGSGRLNWEASGNTVSGPVFNDASFSAIIQIEGRRLE